MGEARGLGVTSCLARRANILDCSKPTGIENLFIRGAGARASKPAELLASSDFASLLKEAIVHFDQVVIDSAPINAVSDTLELGPIHSDSSLPIAIQGLEFESDRRSKGLRWPPAVSGSLNFD
jgi:Mrp family chromosome partitioning ATPase